jgi:hypothetical protein
MAEMDLEANRDTLRGILKEHVLPALESLVAAARPEEAQGARWIAGVLESQERIQLPSHGVRPFSPSCSRLPDRLDVDRQHDTTLQSSEVDRPAALRAVGAKDQLMRWEMQTLRKPVQRRLNTLQADRSYIVPAA